MGTSCQSCMPWYEHRVLMVCFALRKVIVHVSILIYVQIHMTPKSLDIDKMVQDQEGFRKEFVAKQVC